MKQQPTFKVICFQPIDSQKPFEVSISPRIVSAIKKISPIQKKKIDLSCTTSAINELIGRASKQWDYSKIIEIWDDNFPESPYQPQESVVANALCAASLFRPVSLHVGQDSLETAKNNPEAKWQSVWNSLHLTPKSLKENPRAKQQVLWLLQFGEYRFLNSIGMSRVLTDAMAQAKKENDLAFFIKLGRRLMDKPKPLMKNINYSELNPLKRLMLWHWAAKSKSNLQFCSFTDQALADFLTIVTPGSGATFDVVRQTRKRLKIKQMRPSLVRKVTQKNGVILLS